MQISVLPGQCWEETIEQGNQLAVTAGAGGYALVLRIRNGRAIDNTTVPASTTRTFGPYSKTLGFRVWAVGAAVVVNEADEVSDHSWTALHDTAAGKRIKSSLYQYPWRRTVAPLSLGDMASPPSFTSSNTYTLANEINYDYETPTTNRALYQLSGGSTTVVAGSGLRFRGSPLAADNLPSTEGYGTVSWITDAPKSVFQVPNGTTSIYRLLVEEPGSPPRYVAVAGTAANGTSPTYFIIDWSGARKIRRYTLELQTNDTFRGIRTGPTDTMYVPPSDRLRFTLMGDSYAYGTTSDSAGTQLRHTSLVGWLRDLLSADIAPSALGSTGMSVANSKLKFADPVRIAHAISTAPDVMYVAGSLNDGGQTAATLQTDTTTLLAGLRAGLPGVPIIVQGPFGGRLNVSANMLAVEDGMSAAVAAFADPLVAFVPTMRAAKPWMYGTGYQGATNASGNSDFLVGTDFTHPTIYGSEVLGRLMAASVVEKLIAMGF